MTSSPAADSAKLAPSGVISLKSPIVPGRFVSSMWMRAVMSPRPSWAGAWQISADKSRRLQIYYQCSGKKKNNFSPKRALPVVRSLPLNVFNENKSNKINKQL